MPRSKLYLTRFEHGLQGPVHAISRFNTESSEEGIDVLNLMLARNLGQAMNINGQQQLLILFFGFCAPNFCPIDKEVF